MAEEIERKFLVQLDKWQPQSQGTEIAQGYLCLDPERTVRVRLKGQKGYLTIKGKNQGIRRVELEYEIPPEEARQMLQELCLKPILAKMRYVEEYAGQIWEIDIFHGENEGLVVAEAELTGENQQLTLPQWAGKEVSGDVRYYNSHLIMRPFKQWQAIGAEK